MSSTSAELQRFDHGSGSWGQTFPSTPERSVFFIVSTMALQSVTDMLRRSNPGRDLLAGLAARHSALLGMELSAGDEARLPTLLATVGAERTSVLAVELGSHGNIPWSAIGSTLDTFVAVDAPGHADAEPVDHAEWRARYSISVGHQEPDSGHGLGGNHLRWPATDAPELQDPASILGLVPVCHTLNRWCLGTQGRSEYSDWSEPWRDRDFVTINGSMTVRRCLLAMRARASTYWSVVQLQPDDLGSRRSIVLRTGRLQRALDAALPDHRVGDVVPDPSSPDQPLSTVGPYLDPGSEWDAVACVDRTGQVRAVATKLTAQELRRDMALEDGSLSSTPGDAQQARTRQQVSVKAPERVMNGAGDVVDISIGGDETYVGPGALR